MPFPFSFVFAVPGIANPFNPAEQLHAQDSQRFSSPDAHIMNGRSDTDTKSVKRGLFRRRTPPLVSLEPTEPTSKKRRWAPSRSEPSKPKTSRTSASSSRYPEMQSNASTEDASDDAGGDLPPPKRRKTLAGSIVSTALSAALIGTAVGLTVFRLWKGKQTQQLPPPPPPPYDQGEWVPPGSVGAESESDKTAGPHYVSQPDPCEYPESSASGSATPVPSRRKTPRHVAGKRATRHRKTPAKTFASSYAAYTSSYSYSASHSPSQSTGYASSNPPVTPQFNFDFPEPEAQPAEEDEMDWIGDKLAKLIEEGKRALGTEVVVMSETPEDEVDDGSGQWVEDEGENRHTPSSSMRQSRSQRPRSLTVSSAPYPTTPRTPRKNHPHHGSSSAFSSPGERDRNASVDSARSWYAPSHQEDESAWQSPEIRAYMERARQQYAQRKQVS